ncbi:MAG: hypothetical protein WA738_13735 [Candidatus Angelobacter sp.]
MVSLVYLAKCASDAFCGELRRAGYHVAEAFSVPETFWLCSQHYAETVIVSADFDDPALEHLQQRYNTLRMKAHASPGDVFAELSAAN